MLRCLAGIAAVLVALMMNVPAWADYAAGKRAWDAGRFVEAISEWEEAAAEGDRRAMVTLGHVYRRGVGAPQDYILAHMWLNLAAGRGDALAAAERDALVEQMTVEERGEARQLAREWRAASKPTVAVEAPASQSREAEAAAEQPPPRAIQEAQSLLAAFGYDPGPADGKWGRRSARAYLSFLRDAGLPASRQLTPEALRTMRTIAARQSRPAETAAGSRAPSEPASDEPSRPASTRGSLHQIVQAGDIDGLNAALKAGADVNTRDKSGWSPLMHAASRGYTLMVPPLLSAQADVNSRAADGATALFMAVLQGHEEIATMLVRAGADISIRGPKGRTPPEIAQLQNLDRIATFLKRADADRAAYSAAVKANTAERYIRYIRTYPNGLFVQEAKQRRDVARDREAFQRAQAANTAASHRRYVKDYPTGRYRDKAVRLIMELDTREYSRAVNLDSAAAYQSYIASSPRGLFVEEAKEKRKQARDREMFVQAKSRNTIKAIRDYLAAHPEGAYRVQAQRILKQLRNPIVFSKAQEAHTIEAYTKYLEAYPDGEHAAQAREEIAILKVIGKEFRDCEGCPTMVVVPPGSFIMGSSKGKSRERPRHHVTISEPFAVGKYEVTFAEFRAFVRNTKHDMGERESFLDMSASKPCSSRNISGILKLISWRRPGYTQQAKSPAVCVSWKDAAAYVKWLSNRSGKPYRLLSESEWEYAARAGTRTNFYFGNRLSTKQANYDSSHDDKLSKDRGARDKTTVVGSFPPNQFGLYDMHGNVFEWVEDCWHGSYKGAPDDGRAWKRGGNCSARMIRGGSWVNHAPALRSAYRAGVKVTERFTHYGFRVARDINPSALLSELEPSLPQTEDR